MHQGAVTHEDSFGNLSTVQAGNVQAMSAGSGIRHTERNNGTVPLLLYQIWLRPRTPGGTPSWATRRFPCEDRAGTLTVLASGYPGNPDTLPINADARLLGATLRAGAAIEHRLPPGWSAYLVSTAGHATVNDVMLAARDGGRRWRHGARDYALDDTEILLAELG